MKKRGATRELKTIDQITYKLTSGIENDKTGQRIEGGTVVTLSDLKDWPPDVISNWLEIGVLIEVRA